MNLTRAQWRRRALGTLSSRSSKRISLVLVLERAAMALILPNSLWPALQHPEHLLQLLLTVLHAIDVFHTLPIKGAPEMLLRLQLNFRASPAPRESWQIPFVCRSIRIPAFTVRCHSFQRASLVLNSFTSCVPPAPKSLVIQHRSAL
jgi:hypothetical protein